MIRLTHHNSYSVNRAGSWIWIKADRLRTTFRNITEGKYSVESSIKNDTGQFLCRGIGSILCGCACRWSLVRCSVFQERRVRFQSGIFLINVFQTRTVWRLKPESPVWVLIPLKDSRAPWLNRRCQRQFCNTVSWSALNWIFMII